MTYLKISAIAIFLTAVSLPGQAQEVEPGFEMMEIAKMGELYRSSPALSFEVNVTYADTVNPNNLLESLTGIYRISNGKFNYVIDSVEFVQGSRYNLTVYYHDSLIMVADRNPYSNVLQIPLMDSLFTTIGVSSFAVSLVNDSTRRLEASFDPASTFTKYAITYRKHAYRIDSVEYHIKNAVEDTLGNQSTARIVMHFLNYSDTLINPSFFDESRYVYKEGGSYFTAGFNAAYDTIYSDTAQFNFCETCAVSGWNSVQGQPHNAVRTATDASTGISVSSIATSRWNVYGAATLNQTGGENNNDGNGFIHDSLGQRSNWFNYTDVSGEVYNGSNHNIRVYGLDTGALYRIEWMASRDAFAVATATREMRIVCTDANGDQEIDSFNVKGVTGHVVHTGNNSYTFIAESQATGKLEFWIGGASTSADQYRFGYINTLRVYRMNIIKPEFDGFRIFVTAVQ